jgi:putative membrane protein
MEEFAMLRTALTGVAAAALLSLAACGDGYDDTALVDDRADEIAAADPAAPGVDPNAPMDVNDSMREAQDFADKAAQASLVQIQTGEMAIERASTPEVKALAQQLVDQHTASLNELRSAAMTAALAPLPEALDDFHMRRINDLSETDGDADFDADYIALQVDAHSDAIDLFEDYSRDGDLAALNTWASAKLQDLQAAKVEAEQIKEAVDEQG